MVESDLGFFLDGVLSEILKRCSDHVELILLPLANCSFHHELSMSLPLKDIMPFFKSSCSLDVVESCKMGSEDLFTHVDMFLVDFLIISDVVLMDLSEHTKFMVQLFKVDLSYILRVL